MADYTIRTTVPRPHPQTVDAVREQLATAGFGVLTEIDLQAVLKTKLDVDVAPQVILGACRPELAHRALEAEPSVAALLPCNVVVRAIDETTTLVEAFDPDVLIALVAQGRPAERAESLGAVAEDARQRLTAALAAVSAQLED